MRRARAVYDGLVGGLDRFLGVPNCEIIKGVYLDSRFHCHLNHNVLNEISASRRDYTNTAFSWC